MSRKTNSKKKKSLGIIQYFKSIGYTNRLADCLVCLLFLGLIGGFILAVLSIKYQYTGALMCWTVVFTPIGTAISIVLACVVQKSKSENTGADGEGVKYAIALMEKQQELQDNSDTASI